MAAFEILVTYLMNFDKHIIITRLSEDLWSIFYTLFKMLKQKLKLLMLSERV